MEDTIFFLNFKEDFIKPKNNNSLLMDRENELNRSEAKGILGISLQCSDLPAQLLSCLVHWTILWAIVSHANLPSSIGFISWHIPAPVLLLSVSSYRIRSLCAHALCFLYPLYTLYMISYHETTRRRTKSTRN